MVVTPHDSGDLAIPAIRYPYFNPYTERYEIAETAPQRVHVASGTLAAADTGHIDASPALSIRTVYRGPVPAPLYESPGFLMLVVGGPVPAALLALRRRPKRVRQRPTPSAAGALAALARGGATVRHRNGAPLIRAGSGRPLQPSASGVHGRGCPGALSAT